MMKPTQRHLAFSCALSFLGVLAAPSPLFGQTNVTAYLPVVEPGRSLVGIPVDYPPFLSGTVSQFISPATLQIAETDNAGVPLPSLHQPCYLEIVGPSSHPWLGHRLELNEDATRQSASGWVVLEATSPRNTTSPQAGFAGASVVIRPHLTLQAIFEGSLATRLPELRAETLKFWATLPGQSPWAVEPRSSPQGNFLWVTISPGRTRAVQPDEAILPPGNSVQVESRLAANLRTSLTGLKKNHPCRVPLSAGPNLLAYPYPVEMRLGVDWGDPSSGIKGSAEARNSDQVSFWSQEARRFLTYGYFQAPGSAQGIWREIRTQGGSQPAWAGVLARPVIIEPGEGWIFRKISADPFHTFYPPRF